MDNGDPVMEMYKAKAMVIEKEVEIEELRRRIGEFERERQQRNQGTKEVRTTKKGLLEMMTLLEDRIKGENETILIIGGERNNKILEDMVILDRKTATWKVLDLKLPCKNNYGGSALLNGEIHIFGGIELKKKFYKLDSQQMRWIELAEMNEDRRGINNSSLVFQECIWVFGGWKEDGEDLNTVEKYCPERNAWIEMPEMCEKRTWGAATVCNEKIFVSGGHDGLTFLKSVECFDPTSGVWTPMVDLPDVRRGHSMISDGSSLFVMGGGNGVNNFKAGWRIRPSEENAIWEELQPMNVSRRSFTAKSLCCSTLGDKKEIFAIGGWNGKKYLNSVEIFDGERWRDGSKFPFGCCSMSSVVIPFSLAKTLLHCYKL